jgi:hypothetical protein
MLGLHVRRKRNRIASEPQDIISAAAAAAAAASSSRDFSLGACSKSYIA